MPVVTKWGRNTSSWGKMFPLKHIRSTQLRQIKIMPYWQIILENYQWEATYAKDGIFWSLRLAGDRKSLKSSAANTPSRFRTAKKWQNVTIVDNFFFVARHSSVAVKRQVASFFVTIVRGCWLGRWPNRSIISVRAVAKCSKISKRQKNCKSELQFVELHRLTNL